MNDGRARRTGGCNEWSLASEPPLDDGRTSVEMEVERDFEGVGATESGKAASLASSSSSRRRRNWLRRRAISSSRALLC